MSVVLSEFSIRQTLVEIMNSKIMQTTTKELVIKNRRAFYYKNPSIQQNLPTTFGKEQ